MAEAPQRIATHMPKAMSIAPASRLRRRRKFPGRPVWNIEAPALSRAYQVAAPATTPGTNHDESSAPVVSSPEASDATAMYGKMVIGLDSAKARLDR